MKKLKLISVLLALLLLVSVVPVSAETTEAVSGIAINNVTYEVTGINDEFIKITAGCTEQEGVTAVSVMVVPENTETVTLNDIIYINRFGKSNNGEYTITLSKSKILEKCGVEKISQAQLSLRMGTNISQSAETFELAFDEVNITEILPLRTHRVEFDNEAKTITVKALSGNATAGFGIVTEEASTWMVDEADRSRLGLVYANPDYFDGAQVVVAKQANGMQQTFEVDITCGTKTETYTVNLEFIDESLINFTDVLGVRIVSYDVNYSTHKVNLTADRYNTSSASAGFGLVLPENVTAEYTLVSTTDGGTTVSKPTTTAYTSTYLGMESGYYGAMPVRVMLMSNGHTQVTEAVLTNTVLGESITWTINLMFRDPAHEGDVDISELIGLRTTSATFDNEAKTITLVAPSSVSSAGCTAISDNPSAVRQFTAESGKNLAYGNLDGERYVVAYQTYGTTQTYRVKVFGGEDGYEYSWYTVTITFEDAPLTTDMDSNATLGGEMFEINSTEEVELEDVVWVDDYEASLEEIPQNLVWDEELLDFVPAE